MIKLNYLIKSSFKSKKDFLRVFIILKNLNMKFKMNYYIEVLKNFLLIVLIF